MAPMVASRGNSPATAQLRSLVPALLLHTTAFLWFSRVWLFHASPAAALLPGSQGFGWFMRYLTFYTFTFQTAALGLSAADGWLTLLGRGVPLVARLADDLSCTLFAGSHVVSIMFHAIQAATANKGIFSAMDAYRPWWLSPSVHALNMVVAWADMLISGKRSFSRASERMSTALVLGYILLLNLSGYMNGEYPYPFMNKAKQPHCTIVTVAVGVVIFAASFKAGKAAGNRARAAVAGLTQRAVQALHVCAKGL